METQNPRAVGSAGAGSVLPDAQAHSASATEKPTFATFDLTPIDDVSADLEVLRSMIDVAVDVFDSSPKNAQCLLFGALNQLDLANNRLAETHRALLHLQLGGRK